MKECCWLFCSTSYVAAAYTSSSLFAVVSLSFTGKGPSDIVFPKSKCIIPENTCDNAFVKKTYLPTPDLENGRFSECAFYVHY